MCTACMAMASILAIDTTLWQLTCITPGTALHACSQQVCYHVTMQVLQEHLKMTKKPKVQHKPQTPSGVGSGVQSLLLPMELRLVLQGAVVKFEHHPLEV